MKYKDVPDGDDDARVREGAGNGTFSSFIGKYKLNTTNMNNEAKMKRVS